MVVGTHVLAEESEMEVNVCEGDGKKKVEAGDWEDAAEMSTPKLQSSGSGNQASVAQVPNSDRNEANGRNKYSHDSLLTFAHQCSGLPLGIRMNTFNRDVVVKSYVIDREPHPSSGRSSEQAKQRQLKAILNRLTPQNFDKLFEQVIEVNIDNVSTLTAVVSQIFDIALMEPTFCEMYANFCFHLAGALPVFLKDDKRITFKRLMLNKCQNEFEKDEREKAEADKTEEEGEVKQTKEETEEKTVQARRRKLGNIRLIGEFYKKGMLTERIIHECIKKLFGNHQNPDEVNEVNIEALCKLMSTIGQLIDRPKAREHMEAYFDVMRKLSTSQLISSRVRFLLRDSIDLRKNKWQRVRGMQLRKDLLS